MKQPKYVTLRVRLKEKSLHKLKVYATKHKSNMSKVVLSKIADIIS